MKSDTTTRTDAERQTLQQIDALRQTQGTEDSFLRDLFLGRLRLNQIHPFPVTGQERPAFKAFYKQFKAFLQQQVDPVQLDTTGEYPPAVIDGLRQMGAFGMKIPKEYGGLGFTQIEYNRVMELLGGHERGLAVLLSAAQAIGLPQPVYRFGTEEQKKTYLPRCAAGAISGFALTETGIGSDPASLATRAEPTEDGEHYILNGEKLWISNGPLAELLVVVARNPRSDKISAFIVETDWPGVQLAHRCHFMGLRGEANGVIRFTNVKVPRTNLLGEEGKGLKVALVTLNTGRLSLPAITAGAAKQCLEICRKWASVRVQWGRPIGEHEANAHKLADMAATVYAMDTLSDFAALASARENYDIRLEAAAAKEWNTSQAWRIVDDTLQIRGGRGYESETSLAARGEAPIGIERMMRDTRITRIFEGTSEIMHLFMAREAVDTHLQVAGILIDPDKRLRQKLAAVPRIVAFYAVWYSGLCLAWGYWPRVAEFGRPARHLRFVERASRKLARVTFYGLLRYQGRLPQRQAFLFRLVDIATELFVMALCVSRAHCAVHDNPAQAPHEAQLADLFCRNSRRRVKRLFREAWHNDDALKYQLGRDTLVGTHAWLERGTMELGLTAEELRPVPAAERPAETPQSASPPQAGQVATGK